MNFKQKLTAIAAVACMSSVFAATPAEHKAAKDQISADYKAAKAQCDTLSGNAKDVCEKEAKGREKVAEAELEYRADASERNRHNIAKAKADAEYDVAKEKCDDLKGNAKDVCEKDAKAAHVKATEAAKMNTSGNVGPMGNAGTAAMPAATQRGTTTAPEARRDASQEKVREAEYKAARERCDALSGDVKDKCVADAKRIHGQ
ncbi:hypothetical protein [Comamonas endophytica]|uniref:Cell envelope biogenesis protein TolA n=1 Tax=Comamonas endophytica TaxID=2949090 RepID=A0ABY6GA10_9BURK|nr:MULTISPECIES: hypothetical protein [unclassified Acidovorax]MCD2513960.1 hypothetical protein [Acidovorax sp. D4N7]UYG51698.1 hypothetical protein M9799_00065 [Acidovorax sp. 5MLIR]UYG52047.1 hypothetical protein M9799_02030 [Acidovorax sp. 5MLIR]